MRTLARQQPESLSNAASGHAPLRPRSACGAHGLSTLLNASAALLAAQSLLACILLAAQTPVAPAANPAQRPSSLRKNSKTARHAAQAASAHAPNKPKPPDWPANDQPAAASIAWDSQGLLIVASNSSLTQILQEVSMKTGIKIEGIGGDERIFGAYGPGSVHDVLSQLLDGSGYNVLMIGDQGYETPRQIVLSMRAATAAQSLGSPSPGTSYEEDTDAGQQPEQPMKPEQPRQQIRQQQLRQQEEPNP